MKCKRPKRNTELLDIILNVKEEDHDPVLLLTIMRKSLGIENNEIKRFSKEAQDIK